MGVLDFFKSRKEGEVDLEELGIKEEAADEPRYQEESFKPAYSERETFESPSFPKSEGMSETNIQLILTKLDLINQRLENMDRRLQVIEKLAKE